jgi:hypothetical protein
MKPDQRLVCDIVQKTVVQLCERGLQDACNIQIRGVIGVTVNDTDVFIIHIDEDVKGYESISNIVLDPHCEESLSQVAPDIKMTSSVKAVPCHRSTASPLIVEAKKRLIFPQSDLKTESPHINAANDGISLPVSSTELRIKIRPEASVSCRKRLHDHDNDKEALVIVDSDEENAEESLSSDTMLQDEFGSPDDDCILADPGVSSLRITSVVGSEVFQQSSGARNFTMFQSHVLKRELVPPVNSNVNDCIQLPMKDDRASSSNGSASSCRNADGSLQTPLKAGSVPSTSSQNVWRMSTPPAGHPSTSVSPSMVWPNVQIQFLTI